MWQHLLFILPLLVSTSSIKVPVDNIEPNVPEKQSNSDEGQKTNVFYISDDANVDSYLIPPNPHKPEEPLSNVEVAPATYLLPPAQDQRSEYFIPPDTAAQSDWLPIQAEIRPETPNQRQPKAIVPIFLNPNHHEAYQAENTKAILNINRFSVPVPSIHLEPPSVDAVNEFIVTAPEETELSVEDQNEPLADYKLTYSDVNAPENYQLNPVAPTLALHLVPPKPDILKNPTKLYPKKFSGFKPLPIPIAQFSDDNLSETPKAKPVKYFKPLSVSEADELPQSDEKNLYHYKKAEHQRKLKGEEGPTQPPQLADGASQETYGKPEQETSETNFRYPGRDVYPAPVHRAPAPSLPRDSIPAPGPDGRTEFRMHGLKGPHSYQFGFDTGKGKNRQFRYEERDNDGLVRGHYGYMDKSGKLRVVNYSAHPEYGFHAEEPQEKQ